MTEAWIEAARRWRAAKQNEGIARAARDAAQAQFEMDNAPLFEDMKEAQRQFDMCRKALIAEGTGKSEAEGVSVSIAERRGQVDWKSAAAAAYTPALHGASFDRWADQHRKPGSTVATVKEA